MTEDTTERVGFGVKDCALAAIATGMHARDLSDFSTCLQNVHPGSIYYHFWGGLIQPRFEEREYNNDFAGFVRHGLHDAVLAERLAMVDPTDFHDTEMLRQELLELIDERLDEAEYLLWVRSEQPFEFIRSQIVVFDTGRRIKAPEDLAVEVPALSANSIFYHFIDARRRLEGGIDDFRFWLDSFGDTYADLGIQLAQLDPFFVTLSELRRQLGEVFHTYFVGRAV